MLNMSLLNIFSKLRYLSFSLLIELNLSSGSSSCFIKSLSHIFKFSGKIRSLSLSLGSGLSLSFQFRFKFFYSCLVLLDRFLDLSNQRLFIFKFAQKCSGILVLPIKSGFQFSLLPFQIGQVFLCNLKFSLNLSSLLLYLCTSTLLFF